jgi:carbon monoxide dehydrogenase subunit G
MARYATSIEVPLQPADALNYMAEFANTLEWDPGVVEAERLTPGELGPGSAFRVVTSFLGARLALRYEIVEYAPPHRVVLRAQAERFDSVDEILVEPAPAGSRIRYDARLTLRGIWRLADPWLQLAFNRIGAAAIRGLARRLRAVGPPEPAAPVCGWPLRAAQRA